MSATPRRSRAALAALALLVATLLAGGGTAAAQEDLEVGRARLVDADGERIAGGGSATPFAVELPDGAECQGDSANDGYRVNSYLVPSEVSPTDVRYDGLGPTPNAYGDRETFRQPLYDVDTTFFVSIQLLNNEEPGQPGQMQPFPLFDLDVYAPGDLPAGGYHLGIACTLDNAITRVWDTEIEVREDPTDEPSGIAWSVVDPVASDDQNRPAVPIAIGLAAAATATVLLLRRRQSVRSAPHRRNP